MLLLLSLLLWIIYIVYNPCLLMDQGGAFPVCGSRYHPPNITMIMCGMWVTCVVCFILFVAWDDVKKRAACLPDTVGEAAPIHLSQALQRKQWCATKPPSPAAGVHWASWLRNKTAFALCWRRLSREHNFVLIPAGAIHLSLLGDAASY